MSKKYVVHKNGVVANPFLVSEYLWFYASSGNFDIVLYTKRDCCHTFSIPTRTIRKALALVDSVKKRKK